MVVKLKTFRTTLIEKKSFCNVLSQQSKCKCQQTHNEPKVWAPPGIEPGPPAPKAGILPLNYGAYIRINLDLKSEKKRFLNIFHCIVAHVVNGSN